MIKIKICRPQWLLATVVFLSKVLYLVDTVLPSGRSTCTASNEISRGFRKSDDKDYQIQIV